VSWPGPARTAGSHRPHFQGRRSGDFLMSALHRVGSPIARPRSWDDGCGLDDRTSCAVRCAPPDDKPLPEEIVRCRRHMVAEIAALPRCASFVALGKIGFDAYPPISRAGHVVRPTGVRPRARAELGHGLPCCWARIPSRQNTNTGKLTPACSSRCSATREES